MQAIEKNHETRVLEMLSWSKTERAENYKKSFAAIVSSITECATCFVAMSQAGDDVSFVPSGLAAYYKKIVYGQMLPDVMNLDGGLRQKVSALPIHDQKSILDGKRLPLVVIENGATSIRNVDPKSLLPEQVRQLFGRGYIRAEEEQRSWIETHSKKNEFETPEPNVHVNARGGFISVNGVKLSRKDLVNYLAQLTD